MLRENLGRITACVLVALVVALPMLAFFRAHPQDLTARWAIVGIRKSGWLDAQVASTGRSQTSILIQQFLHAALGFNLYPDVNFLYRPGVPLLRFGAAVFAAFGFGYTLAHIRERKHGLLVIWFLLVIILGGMMLTQPPASPRLVLALPVICLWVAMGISRLCDYAARALRQPSVVGVVASMIVVLTAAYGSASFYLTEYTASGTFAGQNTQVADRMGKYLHALGPEYRCYFFGAPRMYYDFSTRQFYAREVPGEDVREPIVDRIEFVKAGSIPVFVFLPERQAELEIVRRAYPSGALREFRDDQGHLLFVSYEANA